MERKDRVFDWIAGQPDAKEGVVSFLEKREPDFRLSVSRDKPDFAD